MKTNRLKMLAATLLLLMSACSSNKPEADELTWATFNVRYDNSGDGDNRWAQRKDRVCRFIKEQGFDVVGLQEVLHQQFLDLRAGLPGYSAVGVGRNDGATQGEYAAIFYRSDSYELLESGNFWLSETPDSAGSKGWDAADVRIVTWAKLKNKHTDRQLMAVNTHFDHIGVEARRRSAHLLLDSLRSRAADIPVVVTGDFNVADSSEAYRLLTTDRFPLADAHKVAAEVTGAAYTFHDFARLPKAECEKIDFIFVSPHFEVLRSEVVPENPDSLLSDHNPQWVRMRLKPSAR